MAHIFLSDLKATLDNCIAELEELHFCSAKIRRVISINILFQLPQNLPLHSNKYDGILQGINARMILYNFCELVTYNAVVKHLRIPNTSIKLILPPRSTYAEHISNTAVTKQRLYFSYKGI